MIYIIRFFQRLWRQNIFFGGVPRSSGWSKVRADFIKGKCCALCGGTKLLEVHHIEPFHLYPEKELDPKNLIVLCEGNKSMNCHLQFGHFNNYATKWNVNIVAEALAWNKRFLAKNITGI